MIETDLTRIIERLDAMKKDETDDVQIRYFQKEGQTRTKAIYNHISGLFTIVDLETDVHFKFDNIDMSAIEVFEMIVPGRRRSRTKY